MNRTHTIVWTGFLLLAFACFAGCGRQSPPTEVAAAGDASPEWSKPNAGLRSRLTLPEDIYRQGEPIPFTLEIQNVSDVVVSFQLSRYPKSLHIRTDDGKEMPYSGPQSSTPALLITLEPTDTYRFTRTVRQENYLLPEGVHVAHFEEKESGGDEFVAVTLMTSPVTFKIIKKEETP